MTTCFINSVGNISAQKTFDNSDFLGEVVLQDTTILPVVAPNYKVYINRAASRRMGKGTKMGVVASAIALKEAGVTQPDAILTGSGLGCMRDTEKFLESILDNDEQYLTPTAFVQSTHNTVGAQIALGLKCTAYNMTYVQGAISFESALLDARLLLQEAAIDSPNKKKNILVGGIEEMGDHMTQLFQLVHHVKSERVSTLDLLNTTSKGTIVGEGAQFFVLSNQRQERTYAQLKDLEIISRLDVEMLEKRLVLFLEKNELTVKDIDVLILGNNGDIAFDATYQSLQNGLFKSTLQVYYKHLCGEYYTASAFGFWVAAKILKTQQIPSILRLNKIAATPVSKGYQRVLSYNQYRGENHSFILMEKPS